VLSILVAVISLSVIGKAMPYPVMLETSRAPKLSLYRLLNTVVACTAWFWLSHPNQFWQGWLRSWLWGVLLVVASLHLNVVLLQFRVETLHVRHIRRHVLRWYDQQRQSWSPPSTSPIMNCKGTYKLTTFSLRPSQVLVFD
jgi:hypothetical protein